MPAHNNKNKTVVVTGATGQQGGAAARRLRERGFPVRALTRDPEQPKARALVGHGTEVVRGDMENEASLAGAMDGIYGVYSVQNSQTAGIEGEIAKASASQTPRNARMS